MTTSRPASTPPHDAPPSQVFFVRAEGCGHPLLNLRVVGAFAGQLHISRDDLPGIRDQVQRLIDELDAADAGTPPV